MDYNSNYNFIIPQYAVEVKSEIQNMEKGDEKNENFRNWITCRGGYYIRRAFSGNMEGVEKVRQYLKKLREEKGLTQQEVAEKMRIGQSYYSDIELAVKQVDMNLSIAEKLAEVFDIPVAQIIEEEKKLKGA